MYKAITSAKAQGTLDYLGREDHSSGWSVVRERTWRGGKGDEERGEREKILYTGRNWLIGLSPLT